MPILKKYLLGLLYAGRLIQCTTFGRFGDKIGSNNIKHHDFLQEDTTPILCSKPLKELADTIDDNDGWQLILETDRNTDSYESNLAGEKNKHSKPIGPSGSLTRKSNGPRRLYSLFKGLSRRGKNLKNTRLNSDLTANNMLQYEPEELYHQVKHLHDTLQDHPLYYSLLSHDTFQTLVDEVSVLPNHFINSANNSYTQLLDIEVPPQGIIRTLQANDSSPVLQNTSQARPYIYYANDPEILSGSSYLQSNAVPEVPLNTSLSMPLISTNLFKAIDKLHNQISMAEPLVNKAGAILKEMLTEKDMDEDTAINLLPSLLPLMHEVDATSSPPSLSPAPSLSPLLSSTDKSQNINTSSTSVLPLSSSSSDKSKASVNTPSVNLISSSEKYVNLTPTDITSTLQMTKFPFIKISESLEHTPYMQSSISITLSLSPVSNPTLSTEIRVPSPNSHNLSPHTTYTNSVVTKSSLFPSNTVLENLYTGTLASETAFHNATSTITVTHYSTTISTFVSSLSNNSSSTLTTITVPSSSTSSYSFPVVSIETTTSLHPDHLTESTDNSPHDDDLTGNFMNKILTTWSASSENVLEEFTEDTININNKLLSSYNITYEEQPTNENATTTIPNPTEDISEDFTTLPSSVSLVSADNISPSVDHVTEDYPASYPELQQNTPIIQSSSSIKRNPSDNKDNPETAGPVPNASNKHIQGSISDDSPTGGIGVKREKELPLPELSSPLQDSILVENDGQSFSTPPSKVNISYILINSSSPQFPRPSASTSGPTGTESPKLNNHYRTSSPPQIFDRLSLILAEGSTTQPPITAATQSTELSDKQLLNALLLLSHLQETFNSQQTNAHQQSSESSSSIQLPVQPGIQVSVTHNTPNGNHNSEFDVNAPSQPLGPPSPPVSQQNSGFQGYGPGYYPPIGTYTGYPRNPQINPFFNNQYPQYPYPYPYHIPQYICQGGGVSTSTSTGPGSASAAAAAGGGCGGGSTSTSTSVGQSAGAAPGTVSVGTNSQRLDQVNFSPNPASGQAPVVKPPAIPVRDVSKVDTPPTTRSPPFSIRFGSRSTTTTPPPSIQQDNYVRVLTALSTLMQYLNTTRQEQKQQRPQQQQQVTTTAPNSFSVSVDLYVPILSELLRRTTTTTPAPPLVIFRPLPISRPQIRPGNIRPGTSQMGSRSQSIQELLINGYTAG
ncbi:uncharacterized protein [Palaemon carinicauda]|uniref:uncharacterized protein isoform X2 n=1 Tax=Palaemon carinicauda TaxID=392227 RepID=UPI0035B6495B